MHSPEPWEWAKNGATLLPARGACVLSTEQDYECSPSDEDAARIVACVNFCRGVSIDELQRAEALSQKYPPNSFGELLDCRQRFRELLNVTAERLP